MRGGLILIHFFENGIHFVPYILVDLRIERPIGASKGEGV